MNSAMTSPTQFANPVAEGATDKVALSDMAQKMLANITNLQTDFQKVVEPSANGTDSIAEATGKGGDEAGNMDAAKMLAEQMRQSSEVQQQLTRFVMASSMSSSLGRNLNMFLRGQ